MISLFQKTSQRGFPASSIIRPVKPTDFVAEDPAPENKDELATENIDTQLNELSDEDVSNSLSQHLDSSVIAEPDIEKHSVAADLETSQDEVENSQQEVEALPQEPDTIDSVIDLAIMEKENTLTEKTGATEKENDIVTSEMPSLTDEDLNMAYEQSLSKFAEDLENDDEPSLEELNIDSETDTPDLIDSDFSFSETDSIEAKIAQAKGDDSHFEVNEIPLSNDQMSELYEFQQSQSSQQSLAASEIPELDDTPTADAFAHSELVTPEALDIATTAIEPGSEPLHMQGKAGFNLNIPFELHTQLSQKIDNLVIEATTSLTNELHIQLANRMETLLNNSVESVLPKLIEQMAGELRREVKQQVKNQLPHIINDVLGRTRLQK